MHLSQSFDLTSYGAAASLDVFTAAVVGGLGSLFGGVLGAVFLRGSEWFITAPEWRLLSSALGVLIVLLILPGGLASLVIKIRDWYVGVVLRRRGIDPPRPRRRSTTDRSPPRRRAIDETRHDDVTRTPRHGRSPAGRRRGTRRTEHDVTAPDQSAHICAASRTASATRSSG